MIIAVPTGIKIFMDSNNVGRIYFQNSYDVGAGFIFMFTVGGAAAFSDAKDIAMHYLLCRNTFIMCCH